MTNGLSCHSRRLFFKFFLPLLLLSPPPCSQCCCTSRPSADRNPRTSLSLCHSLSLSLSAALLMSAACAKSNGLTCNRERLPRSLSLSLFLMQLQRASEAGISRRGLFQKRNITSFLGLLVWSGRFLRDIWKCFTHKIL